MNKGFTLIELLIYMSLFSMFIATSVMTAFYLLQASHDSQKDIARLKVEQYIFSKLNWIFNSKVDVLVPVASTVSGELMVYKDAEVIEVRLEDHTLLTRSNGGEWRKMHNDDFKVQEFTVSLEELGSLQKITVHIRIDDRHATSSYFLQP